MIPVLQEYSTKVSELILESWNTVYLKDTLEGRSYESGVLSDSISYLRSILSEYKMLKSTQEVRNYVGYVLQRSQYFDFQFI